MFERLNLNKADIAYLAIWKGNKYEPITVTVKSVRKTKTGHVTYFVVREDGQLHGRSYNEYGFANFKDWRDSAWCMHPSRLFADNKTAKQFCKLCKKGA